MEAAAGAPGDSAAASFPESLSGESTLLELSPEALPELLAGEEPSPVSWPEGFWLKGTLPVPSSEMPGAGSVLAAVSSEASSMEIPS